MAGNKKINDELELKHQLNTSFDIDNIKVSEELIQRTLYRLKEEKEQSNLNNHKIHNTVNESISNEIEEKNRVTENQQKQEINRIESDRKQVENIDSIIDRKKSKRWNHKLIATLATLAAAIGIIIITNEIPFGKGKGSSEIDVRVESHDVGILEDATQKQVEVTTENEYAKSDSIDIQTFEAAGSSSETRMNPSLAQGEASTTESASASIFSEGKEENSASDTMDMFIGSITLMPLNDYLVSLTKEEYKSFKVYTTNTREYNLDNKRWSNLIDTISKYETVDIPADFISEPTYEIHIEKEEGIMVIELGNDIKITDEMGIVLYHYEILGSSMLLREIKDIITVQ